MRPMFTLSSKHLYKKLDYPAKAGMGVALFVASLYSFRLHVNNCLFQGAFYFRMFGFGSASHQEKA